MRYFASMEQNRFHPPHLDVFTTTKCDMFGCRRWDQLQPSATRTTRTEIPMGEGIRLMDLKSPTPQGVLRLLVLVPGRKNDELGGETRSVGHGHEEKPEKPAIPTP